VNVTRATIQALRDMRGARYVANKRNLSIEEVLGDAADSLKGKGGDGGGGGGGKRGRQR